MTSKLCSEENIAVFYIPSALSVTTHYTVTTIPSFSGTYKSLGYLANHSSLCSTRKPLEVPICSFLS